ncbi:unnamed protein product [Didymodactylos carnosus]|uniref:PiggyBac transposable element-derived protein domain-containing protein n=1 Tax=Didymodactylos carnosus TaxID=1234261 RepID=A0A8S2D938_9BILA|nr:unnamed protein product [Didymodactylos carnosus]CAF3627978.1 unnamed protein product [Didymodactylos carnosus]
MYSNASGTLYPQHGEPLAGQVTQNSTLSNGYYPCEQPASNQTFVSSQQLQQHHQQYQHYPIPPSMVAQNHLISSCFVPHPQHQILPNNSCQGQHPSPSNIPYTMSNNQIYGQSLQLINNQQSGSSQNPQEVSQQWSLPGDSLACLQATTSPLMNMDYDDGFIEVNHKKKKTKIVHNENHQNQNQNHIVKFSTIILAMITHEENSELPDGLEDGSEDSETGTTDEDDWQEETDVSPVESESDQEPPRRLSKLDQQSESEVFLSKSGRRWSTSEPPKRKIPQANILRQLHGVGPSAARMQTVKDAFQLLFTEEMILIIVAETNRSARKAAEAWNEQNPDKKWQWKDTDSEEIWVFIGLLILAGVQRSQNENLNELWSMNSGRSIFRATMSKNRMDSLLKFCRFDDATTRNTRMEVDKLALISEFWAMFSARLQICYIPGGSMTVDE